MAIITRSISNGAIKQDIVQDGVFTTHELDANVAGTYPINTDIAVGGFGANGHAAGATLTGVIRAKVASTDVIVEASSSGPITVAIEDSPDGTTFTQRATFPVVGGRVRTGYRFNISSGTHYRLKAIAPAGADGGSSSVHIYSQQRP